jgi:electron transfer flavoprotein alpha subunit
VDKVKLITVRSTAFEPVEKSESESGAKVEEVAAPQPLESVQWVKEELVKSDRPELSSAKIVISGGRGLKNGDNFKMLYDLADKLGAAGKSLHLHIYLYIYELDLIHL